MDNPRTLKMAGPENSIIKPATLAEKVAEKIRILEQQNIDTRHAYKIDLAKHKAKRKILRYMLNHLRYHCNLSITQIRKLDEDDFNNLPEVVLAEKKKRVILLGWFPIIGWIYTLQYIWFKKNIRFLKSYNENIFYESAHADIEYWLNPPLSRYHGGSHAP